MFKPRFFTLAIIMVASVLAPTYLAAEEQRDEADRLVSSVDMSDQPILYQYDENGQLIAVRNSDGTVVEHNTIKPEPAELQK